LLVRQRKNDSIYSFFERRRSGGRQKMRDDDAQRFEQLKLALKTMASPSDTLLRPVS
jgi:hypothetical protein